METEIQSLFFSELNVLIFVNLFRTGVAKRIFQQRKPNNTNHYSAPIEQPRLRQRSHSQTRLPSSSPINQQSSSPINQRSLSPLRSFPNSSLNGWSLLNLSDIDKLRTPAYFSSREEAGSRRSYKSFFPEVQKNKKNRKSKTRSSNDLQKYKWLSETCLKNI